MCETDWFRMNFWFWLRKLSKLSVLMLVLNGFHPVRKFRLRFRLGNYNFDTFDCDFEWVDTTSTLLVTISKRKWLLLILLVMVSRHPLFGSIAILNTYHLFFKNKVRRTTVFLIAVKYVYMIHLICILLTWYLCRQSLPALVHKLITYPLIAMQEIQEILFGMKWRQTLFNGQISFYKDFSIFFDRQCFCNVRSEIERKLAFKMSNLHPPYLF